MNAWQSKTWKHAKLAFVCQLAALVLLATVRSDKLLSYSYDLPPSVVTGQLTYAVETWDGWVSAVGISAARNTVIGMMDELRQSSETF